MFLHLENDSEIRKERLQILEIMKQHSSWNRLYKILVSLCAAESAILLPASKKPFGDKTRADTALIWKLWQHQYLLNFVELGT